jgi:hypothetical protein
MEVKLNPLIIADSIVFLYYIINEENLTPKSLAGRGTGQLYPSFGLPELSQTIASPI